MRSGLSWWNLDVSGGRQTDGVKVALRSFLKQDLTSWGRSYHVTTVSSFYKGQRPWVQVAPAFSTTFLSLALWKFLTCVLNADPSLTVFIICDISEFLLAQILLSWILKAKAHFWITGSLSIPFYTFSFFFSFWCRALTSDEEASTIYRVHPFKKESEVFSRDFFTDTLFMLTLSLLCIH